VGGAASVGNAAARAHGPLAEPIPVLHSSDDIAVVWGEIAAAAGRPGRSRPQNDTWVAACCLAYELPLATLNVKDFRDFAEHDGLVLITG
jgi:toxin FitB